MEGKKMKTEKQIWMERETAKIEKQNLSEETKKRMLEMLKDFADCLMTTTLIRARKLSSLIRKIC